MPSNPRATADQLLNSDHTTPTVRSEVPSKLLDLSAPSKSILAISERNKKESRLLNLPSELFLMILKEVMGGQMVHVLPKDSRTYKTRICAAPEDCPTSKSPRVHLAHEDNTVSDGMEDDECFTLRHQECASGVATRSGLDLDVLTVCRQIYKAAVLLPFQENTFIFGLHARRRKPLPTMDGFLNRLNREQREAVRYVTFASDDCRIGNVKSQLARLSGLRSLHMLLAPGDDIGSFYHVLHKCEAFATSYPLSWLPLKTFRITMEAYLDSRGLAALSSQAHGLDRLVRYLEAKTLLYNSNIMGTETSPLQAEVFGVEGYLTFSHRLMELQRNTHNLL